MSEMHRVSFRLPDLTLAALDELAAERHVTRTRLMRQLLDGGLRDRGASIEVDVPDEHELLQLLSERARAGNVAAIRSLLARLPSDRESELQRVLRSLAG